MTRTRTGAAALLTAMLTLLLLPGVAEAATVNDVVNALRSDPVYRDPQATAQVDADRVRDDIRRSGRKIFVAVLPQAAADRNGGPGGINGKIGSQLGTGVILFTVTGDGTLTGGSSNAGLGRGEADAIARRSQGSDVTAALTNAVSQVDTAAASGAQSGSGSDRSGGGFGSGSSGTSSSGSGAGTLLLGLLAVGGLGAGLAVYSRNRKRRVGDLQGSRADVESLYGRLGADVSNLDAGDDAVARQALVDAAERYNATGALLSQADTPGEFAAARRTVVEGLTAARLVRTRLGLDPGPEVPPPPGSGPQLSAEERVRIGDQEYDGSPQYAPGRQHYFGGGYYGGSMVPGGWYSVPFWETLAISSMLGGGFGGGYGYGGGGYERGYEEGVEDSRDAHSDGGGGDWGGGGGSDWGGGADWGGGGGGGGDFGGGGGGDGGGSW